MPVSCGCHRSATARCRNAPHWRGAADWHLASPLPHRDRVGSLSHLTRPMPTPLAAPSAGILADEMGLGKTVQVTAFLAALFRSRAARTACIVAPLSVVSVWEDHLAKWAPGVPFRVFHGELVGTDPLPVEVASVRSGGGCCRHVTAGHHEPSLPHLSQSCCPAAQTTGPTHHRRDSPPALLRWRQPGPVAGAAPAAALYPHRRRAAPPQSRCCHGRLRRIHLCRDRLCLSTADAGASGWHTVAGVASPLVRSH